MRATFDGGSHPPLLLTDKLVDRANKFRLSCKVIVKYCQNAQISKCLFDSTITILECLTNGNFPFPAFVSVTLVLAPKRNEDCARGREPECSGPKQLDRLVQNDLDTSDSLYYSSRLKIDLGFRVCDTQYNCKIPCFPFNSITLSGTVTFASLEEAVS